MSKRHFHIVLMSSSYLGGDIVSIGFSVIEDLILFKNLQQWVQFWAVIILFILVLEVFRPLKQMASRAITFHKLEGREFCKNLDPCLTQASTTDKKAAG